MKYFFIAFFLLQFTTGFALPIWPDDSSKTNLKDQMKELLAGFEGEAGVYLYHFSRKQEIAINADEVFPTASMIKVPIMLTLFSKIEAGAYEYNQQVVYKDSLFYSEDDILGSFKDGQEIAISKLIMLMITMSDNTASLWYWHRNQ